MASVNHEELHVVFGTGPVGLAVMDELVAKGVRVRMVNRSGKAKIPQGVDIRGVDATDPARTREVCNGASVVYSCLNAPYNKWPEMFPPLQDGVLEGAAFAGAKLVAIENLYLYGRVSGKPMTEDLPYAATARKGRTRALDGCFAAPLTKIKNQDARQPGTGLSGCLCFCGFKMSSCDALHGDNFGLNHSVEQL